MSKKILTYLVLLSFVFLPTIQNVSYANVGSIDPLFRFNKDLRKGMTDPDVSKLQKVLNSDAQTSVASSGSGSSGLETEYFGSLTESAVVKFQQKYSNEIGTLGQSSGVVETKTRTKLNSLLSVPVSRQSDLTTCQFVEVLINIGAIAPAQANQGRSALGCLGTVNNVGNANFVDSEDDDFDSNSRSLDVSLKGNGKNNSVNINPGQPVTLSWESEGADKCYLGGKSKSRNSSEVVYPTSSTIYTIECLDDDEKRVVDTLSVNLVLGSNESAQPSVDLKVNNKDSGVSLSVGDSVTVSWTSANVSTCSTGSTTRPTSGSFTTSVPILANGQSQLDFSIACSGANGIVTDIVIADILNPDNNEATGVALGLAEQVNLSISPGTVYFSGTLQQDGKCYGEDDFYRVFVLPKDGVPVIDSQSKIPGTGDSSVRLKLLYWAKNDIPLPVNGSIVLGESDGVTTYKCTSNGDFAGQYDNYTLIDGGVIFTVGQLSPNTDGSTPDSTSLEAGLAGAGGMVPQEEAAAAARKIKPKDDGGFLGTGVDLAVVVAVAAVAACATGVGCVIGIGAGGWGTFIAGGTMTSFYSIGASAAVGYATGAIVDSVGKSLVDSDSESGSGDDF